LFILGIFIKSICQYILGTKYTSMSQIINYLYNKLNYYINS